ncbi:MAG: phage holin family protein [Polyangiaceae bacterium]
MIPAETAPHPAVARPDDDRTVGELFADLASETGSLVRQELRLASVEMSEKASFAGRQLAIVLTGALLGVAALVAALIALFFALATVMALWAASLVVALVAALIAVVSGYRGMASLRAMTPYPEQTIESLRDDRRRLEQRIR